MAVACHNLLTLLKQVRRSGEIFQLFGKNQSESGDQHYLLFLDSQKLILASRQGYFPDLNRLAQSVFRLSRDNYTPTPSINSPPGAYEGGHTDTQRERLKNRGKRGETETYSLASKNSDNYFSNQGANTLRSSSLLRNFRNQARRNSQAEVVREVIRGFYRPSVLRFPEPGEKGIPSGSSPII